MKKKRIKRLLCGLIIKLMCMSNFAQGDVVVDETAEIKGKLIDNNDQLPAFITYINNNNEKGNAVPPSEIAANFVTGINWEMCGFAVFVNHEGTAGRVYVAKKRRFVTGNTVAQNNGNVLNYTSNMHTERQLAIVALEEALGNNLPVVGAPGAAIADKLGPLVNNAKIPLTNEHIPQPDGERTYLLKGALHIYTGDNPCQNHTSDNKEFSCIEYYNALAVLFPHVDFHIYFRASNMRLNPMFIRENDNAKIALLNQLDNLIAQGSLQGLFRRRSYLQVCDGANWKTVQGSDNDYNLAVGFRVGLNNIPQSGKPESVLNSQVLNQADGTQNAITNQSKELLFNAVHNTNERSNIHYHPIHVIDKQCKTRPVAKRGFCDLSLAI